MAGKTPMAMAPTLLLLTVLLLPRLGHAVPISAGQAGRDAPAGLVAAIEIRGLRWTRRAVVERELLVAPGRAFAEAQWQESLRRLRNLGIFRKVVGQARAGAAGVELSLSLDEKWSLTPIFSAGSGGGASQVVAGAMDNNVAGRYLELGAFYKYFAGTHSGEAWLADPRLLGQRLRGDLVLGLDTRNRYLYDEVGSVEGGWTRRRLLGRAQARLEVHRDLTLGAGLEISHDRFSEDLLPTETSSLDAGRALPGDRRDVLLLGSAELGHLDWDDYLVEGLAAEGRVWLSQPLLGSDAAWTRALLQVAAGYRPGGSHNLAARLLVGTISRDIPERVFYVGGLTWKRGFLEGQYRGRRAWNLNLEYRLSSLDGRRIALQHVVFWDLGSVADSWQGLVRGEWLPPWSAGTGLRLILPLVARFLARADLACAVDGPRRVWRLELGSQQFF